MISYNDNKTLQETSYLEISKLCSDLELLKKFSPKEYEKKKEIINSIIFPKNKEVKKNSIGIVLGGPDWKKRTIEGVQSYINGDINKLVLSGGIGFASYIIGIINEERLQPEAFRMYNFIKESITYNLIPKDILKDIILEPNSKNTHYNIENTLKVLTKLTDIKTEEFTIISDQFHIRRSTSILENYLKDINNETDVGNIPVCNGINDLKSWDNSLSSRKDIYMELFLLLNYSKSGIIENQPLILKKKNNK